MHADQLTNLAHKAHPSRPTFQRANVQTFQRLILPLFHSSTAELFLEKTKVQRTIEEQILCPASSTVNRPRSILNLQTFQRANVQTFQRLILPTFHPSIVELFLEKTKIQITIEEQILYPASSTVNRPRSILNVSTFQRSNVPTPPFDPPKT
jgi:hypothetical protein